MGKDKGVVRGFVGPYIVIGSYYLFCHAITGDGSEGLAAYVEPFVILLILILNAIVAIY